MNTLSVHYEPAPLWTKVNALPSLFQAQQWGRCAIIDTFSPLCSSRFHAIDEGVIDRLRTIGLDDDGAYALRHNFGAGDFATHRRSCEWAIKYGGALGVMTLPLTDPGDGANGCPFVGNMYGWNPAMAVLDLDLVDEESVRLMNERGRQLQKETSGDQYEHSFNADALRAFKVKMLEKEYVRVCNSADHPDRDEVEAYIEHPPEKILDYAVTSVLSERFRCAWQSWPEEYKCKKAFEIIEFDASLYEAVKPLLYAQWKLENQVRDYCSAAGWRIPHYRATV